MRHRRRARVSLLTLKQPPMELLDALEWAAAEMKSGEKAILTCSNTGIALEEQLGLKTISAGKAVLTIEMKEFEKGGDTYSLSEDEKIAFGTERKEIGSNLF